MRLRRGYVSSPPGSEDSGDVLVVRDLEVSFPLRRRSGPVRALRGVSLRLGRGEILGLVGESGSGKSTAARAILRVLRPERGEVWLNLSDGPEPRWVDLAKLEGRSLREARRRIQMVFQDPSASLDPRQTAGAIVAEPLRIFRAGSPSAIRRRVEELFLEAGLDRLFLSRYPHEFSGGQRQRIGIARALALRPGVLICDEPVSALDVSIQAQILNLLLDEKSRWGLSYLFISHDLRLVRRISSRLAVMYLGRIVEEGPAEEVFRRPAHPYTEALLSAAPVPDPAREAVRPRILLRGDPPSPTALPAGCAFAGRCPRVFAPCREADPRLEPLSGSSFAQAAPAHRAACFLHHPPGI